MSNESNPGRSALPALSDRLVREPEAFQFFQAVRLLEWAAVRSAQHNQETLAGHSLPQREFLRFRSQASLAFPAADIHRVGERQVDDQQRAENRDKQYEVTTSVLSLLGATGVLPYHYSEQVLERLRQKDSSMKDFFDLFNHRSLSLFYQAWSKYRLPVQYERTRRLPGARGQRPWDSFSQVLASLCGLGTPYLRDRLSVSDERLFGFTGYLMSQPRSAANLEALLHHQFGLRFKVIQFVGQWQRLVPDVLTRLPKKGLPGMNHQLGRNAFIGQYCWHTQGKFRVEIEDLDYAHFMTFAPGSPKMRALQELIRSYSGMELDFEVTLALKKSEIPPIQLTRKKSVLGLLGWNTRLPSHGSDVQRISVRVSARYC